jgi:hypothetical protein
MKNTFTSSRTRRVRAVVAGALLLAPIAVVGASAVPAASAASPQTVVAHTAPAVASSPEPSFSVTLNYHGLAYGWDQNHAWAIGSYAVIASIGSGKAAGLLCGLLSDGSDLSAACDYAVSSIVSGLARGHKSVTNHGIWAAAYPHLFPWPGITYQDGGW